MKFPYTKLITGVHRPILPFLIYYKNEMPLKYFGLVDSGADKTYFGAELANILGIKNLENGKPEHVAGVNGISNAFFHPITINIGGYNFNIEAGFVKDSNLISLGYGLLGQIGLFGNFDIKFSFRKLEMELTPIDLIFSKKRN